MIRHIFFDKCNTIIENSEHNTGLNPVAELNAGENISRILFHFNLDEIKNEYVFNNNTSHLKHILKMTNCGSVNLPYFDDCKLIGCDEKKRASSFDVIIFRVPFEWDGGRGYDYYGDNIKETHRTISTDGSNWYQAKNGVEWDEFGVYMNDTLNDEYIKYKDGKESIIVGSQHFDTGTENLEIDITEYINNLLIGKYENYGLGLAFAPSYELITLENTFISFFTQHTNTFFLPYLECINTDVVLDDRNKFFLNSNNKLYFFVCDNGEYLNLDETPKCNVEGISYEVKQHSKGIYYIDINLSTKDYEPHTILTDCWSNLVYNGELLDDVELEFVLLPLTNKLSLGKPTETNVLAYPQISGINEKENVGIGDIREIHVDFIEEYSHGKTITPNISEYRIYIKNNDREIDVFDYHPIECRVGSHTIIINTNDFIPNTYHVDLRVTQNRNIKIHKDVLTFNIVNNITNFKI